MIHLLYLFKRIAEENIRFGVIGYFIQILLGYVYSFNILNDIVVITKAICKVGVNIIFHILEKVGISKIIEGKIVSLNYLGRLGISRQIDDFCGGLRLRINRNLWN